MKQNYPIHNSGEAARILLSGVFGPYAQDDAYGSRTINPMELYQNQVTRFQGAFSLRMFHRTFGLMMIQANLKAPCTLLDFPSRDRFIEEIRNHEYEIIGISAIFPNIGKVADMCSLIRRYQPRALIAIGGHITGKEGLDCIIDADYIVKGDGIRWFRNLLGEDEKAPIRHPAVISGFGGRIMGIKLGKRPGGTAAILIPSIGCPIGCNFCSTSAHFGGKGQFINFYETGDDLFKVMCSIEAELKVRSFFVLDENFLLHKKRALRLLELMAAEDKSWALYVFSSARVLKSYTMEQLAGLGITYVWMGLEGESSTYRKLNDVNTKELVKTLQDHGIRVLGSSIIGLEHHTPENIYSAVNYAISHNTVFHQFMLYTPLPGTPLYEFHRNEGTLYPDDVFSPADAHGQFRFNYQHRHIPKGQEENLLNDAFRKDFEINGPSLARLIRVMLNGWHRYHAHPDRRIRRRVLWDTLPIRSSYAGAVWAMRKWYRGNDNMTQKMDALLQDLYGAFGWKTRLVAPLLGRIACWTLEREERRLAGGWHYEPDTIYELNEAALALSKKETVSRTRTGSTKPSIITEPVTTS
ncbi:MAG: hypothetical protein CSYNP_03468 [Syntrophus sp. SKADARSKE-3]|nr:hypothetical protein [Syntrophus sp. SKADARSKE-3]